MPVESPTDGARLKWVLPSDASVSVSRMIDPGRWGSPIRNYVGFSGRSLRQAGGDLFSFDGIAQLRTPP